MTSARFRLLPVEATEAMEMQRNKTVPLSDQAERVVWAVVDVIVATINLDEDAREAARDNLSRELQKFAGASVAPIPAKATGEMRTAAETAYVRVAGDIPNSDAMEAALNAALAIAAGQLGEKESAEHDWFKPDFIKWVCCRKCGIVQRADGKNSPCRGIVKVELRDG